MLKLAEIATSLVIGIVAIVGFVWLYGETFKDPYSIDVMWGGLGVLTVVVAGSRIYGAAPDTIRGYTTGTMAMVILAWVSLVVPHYVERFQIFDIFSGATGLVIAWYGAMLFCQEYSVPVLKQERPLMYLIAVAVGLVLPPFFAYHAILLHVDFFGDLYNEPGKTSSLFAGLGFLIFSAGGLRLFERVRANNQELRYQHLLVAVIAGSAALYLPLFLMYLVKEVGLTTSLTLLTLGWLFLASSMEEWAHGAISRLDITE